MSTHSGRQLCISHLLYDMLHNGLSKWEIQYTHYLLNIHFKLLLLQSNEDGLTRLTSIIVLSLLSLSLDVFVSLKNKTRHDELKTISTFKLIGTFGKKYFLI